MEKIEEHESECEHRWITDDWFETTKYLFKDFAANCCQLSVDNEYIKEQKWHFYSEREENKYRGVKKFFIGPDQRRFFVDIGVITERYAPLYVYVVGGKEVAKKYKAELRIFW